MSSLTFCHFFILAFLTVTIPARDALRASETWYLSPTGSDKRGDGSRQRPWKTILYATSRVPDNGSTIVLLDGLYEGRQSVSRQFTEICTIRAETPYRAWLRSAAETNGVVRCRGAANVRFQSLELLGSGGERGAYLVHLATPNTHHISFYDCIIHDSYNNDLVKINDYAHHVVFRNCLLFNPADHSGNELFDINTVTDVLVEDSILLIDYAASRRQAANQSQSFVVVKNSGSTPEVTRRIAFCRNVFLNWQGKPDQSFLLLGEGGDPFFEAQDVMIENNLFIHNTPIQTWGTLLYKGGLKNITFRANTVVGHPAVKSFGAEAVVCIQIEQNPPMGDLTFCNNIWCDPSGRMPRFSISDAKTFAQGSKQVLLNNLYWNAGKPIPTETKDVLAPDRDAKKIVADPRLGNPGQAVTLPRWDPKKGTFLSGQKTIRGEFERLVKLYAVPAPGSPAAGAADPVNMPKDDILANPRGEKPDIGCFQRQAEK